MTTADPDFTIPDDAVIVNISTLRLWAEQVAFAIDNAPEAVDALLELAEGLEDVMAGDR